MKPAVLIVDEIYNNLEFLLQNYKQDKITLKVHPFVYAYLKEGFFNLHRKWQWSLKRRFRIESDPHYHFLEYKFHNSRFGEIDLWENKEERTVSEA